MVKIPPNGKKEKERSPQRISRARYTAATLLAVIDRCDDPQEMRNRKDQSMICPAVTWLRQQLFSAFSGPACRSHSRPTSSASRLDNRAALLPFISRLYQTRLRAERQWLGPAVGQNQSGFSEN